MRCFRLIPELYREELLNGKKTALCAGRWHQRGVQAIYTSETISLAVLEMCSHYDRPFACSNYVVGTIEVPDTVIEHVPRSILPPRWAEFESAMQQFGSQRFAAGVLALCVPSVVHAFECNVVLNAQHPDFSCVQLLRVDPIRVNARIHEQ